MGEGPGLRRHPGDIVRGHSVEAYGGRPRLTRNVDRYDNAYALQQIENGHHSILSRKPKTASSEPGPSKKGKTLPRVITLGGDHTITLPLLRSVTREYGPISVIHFDSHL